MDKDHIFRFSGLDRLYGPGALQKLIDKKVMVLGLGGVGSWVVEALTRSGVGSLVLVDLDDICMSNSNRQLHTLSESIGHLKAEALANRMKSISPEIKVEIIPEFYSAKTSEEILNSNPDLIVDAIDRADIKAHLVASAKERRIPIIVSGASGGKKDLFAIRRGDLAKTRDDRLLSTLRKTLRQKYGFPRGDQIFDVTCVYSEELPMYPGEDGEMCSKPTGEQSSRLDCASGLGAASFLTGSFGFGLAQIAIEKLLAIKP